MATATGKSARKRHGTRFAARRSQARKPAREFGRLPVSASRGNAAAFVGEASRMAEEAPE